MEPDDLVAKESIVVQRLKEASRDVLNAGVTISDHYLPV